MAMASSAAALVGMTLLVTIPACGDGPTVPGGDGELSAEPTLRTYEYTNGRWFNGTSFDSRTMFSAGGRLTDERPASVDSVIDLDGKYVVPAFGDAHQHNIDNSSAMEGFAQQYLSRGVYYIRNPNILPRTVPGDDRVNIPGGVDVIFSNGGFTSPGGHPAGVAQRNVDRGAWNAADLDGAFFWAVATEDELRTRWAEFISANPAPDFVKAYLLYSEEYDRRIASDDFVYWRGMDPELLTVLVELAHGAGLEVFAHVETAADFRNALDAGVDQIGHMPGFRKGQGPRPLVSGDEIYTINAATAARAASDGVPVVTTLGSSARGNVGKTNLRRLHEAGATVLVGTDSYEADPNSEIRSLETSGVFTNLELLRMWSVDTPRSIFPDRQIGSLAAGAEADFLVLDGNPLEDFDALFDIYLRVKSGYLVR